MVIRKLFKVEGAHLVRNCSTRRCSRSTHGHSATIEVFLESDRLDNGGMVVDFSLLKKEVHDFIDSFDHSLSLWSKESKEYLEKQLEWSERTILLPFTPSAENYSLMFLYGIDKIIRNTQFNNGEGNIEVKSVRYHETTTGYAEAFYDDLYMCNYELKDIIFSEGIKSEWKTNWYDDLLNNKIFINPTPEQQICTEKQ